MWVAREEDGTLALWIVEPVPGWYDGPYWSPPEDFDLANNDCAIVIDSKLFPEVTFENSPVFVEIYTQDYLTGLINSAYCQGWDDCKVIMKYPPSKWSITQTTNTTASEEALDMQTADINTDLRGGNMYDNYPNYCETCPNNPKNNPLSNGVCNCILGGPKVTV